MSRIAPGEIQFVTVSFTPTAASYFNQKLALRIVDNPNRLLPGRDTVDGGNPANHLGCKKLVNNGRNYQPQLVQDFFHQQKCFFSHLINNSMSSKCVFSMSCVKAQLQDFPMTCISDSGF